MALALTRPWKHPRTGIYWLRRAVPKDLRDLVGKRKEKRSLATRDRDEARQRHAQALVELDKRWANLRSKPAKLTEREGHEMAVALHDDWFGRHRDEPSSQTLWPIDIGAKVFASAPCRNPSLRMLGSISVGHTIYASAPPDLAPSKVSLFDVDPNMVSVMSLEKVVP